MNLEQRVANLEKDVEALKKQAADREISFACFQQSILESLSDVRAYVESTHSSSSQISQ